jgi:murein DD-endopeptidase MepM/ murein hydrolase activator NlpD
MCIKSNFVHSIAFLIGLIIIPSYSFPIINVSAQSEVERLQSQIRTSNNRLSDIEKEIAKFEAELQKVGAERNTLQRAIQQLELERQKVQAEIRATEQKIEATDFELSKLVLEIDQASKSIKQNKEFVATTIREIHQFESTPFIAVLLGHKQLSDFWNTYEAHEVVRNSMTNYVMELSDLKNFLEERQEEASLRRTSLTQLKNQYSDQNSVLTNNRAERAELLAATRNEEAAYQRILKEKQAARDQIIREMREYESRLQFILDPNTIPPPGTPVFQWPLQNIIITQLFGGTEFAARNAAAYGGRPYHPGVDFGAPRGTPIYAPLGGVVRATGNTDAVPGCFSWGKWTLIDHANGLSTMYAHQDVISVSAGQRVATGEIIGYVGNTGFSTGPHLHFTLYARDGVSIRRFNEIRAVTGCGAATTPVAATEAYIDPMLYLPPPTNVRWAL